ncbi:hypothetical protein OPV22_022588 [Ensete ventricosum]|uniref:Uncharacterized protein n=1 Tax=Ensete ventricosum TaxID=4639 RepID=A0AAV8PEA4_ENSVE|nr:hypothetical protein OPV22_022588 [Ensete ventricosum]
MLDPERSRMPHNGRRGATLVARPRRFRFKGPGASLSARCFSALSPEMKSTIDKVVQSQKVALFMKGTKIFPPMWLLQHPRRRRY